MMTCKVISEIMENSFLNSYDTVSSIEYPTNLILLLFSSNAEIKLVCDGPVKQKDMPSCREHSIRGHSLLYTVEVRDRDY